MDKRHAQWEKKKGRRLKNVDLKEGKDKMGGKTEKWRGPEKGKSGKKSAADYIGKEDHLASGFRHFAASKAFQ